MFVAFSIAACCASDRNSRLLGVCATMTDEDFGLDRGITPLLPDSSLLILDGRFSYDETGSFVEGALPSATLWNLISEPALFEILLKARRGVLILLVRAKWSSPV